MSLPKKQVWDFIQAFSNLKHKAVLSLMYSAGLRVGEVCALRYEDISRSSMRIHICHSKARSDRYAILSPLALQILTDYWFSYGKPCGWLFQKQNNPQQHMVSYTVNQFIFAKETELGLEHLLTCHSFRHAFGTHLYENGTDLLTIKALLAILNCKSGKLGCNITQCPDCGHLEFHNNSCRNRSCPNCQAVNKEIWVDKRRAEVIDSPYFHVAFTLPHELNPLIFRNQKLLYGLLHTCCAKTLLELSSDKKYLGATPGIIQVLHTWNP